MSCFQFDCLTKDGRFRCEFSDRGLSRITFPSRSEPICCPIPDESIGGPISKPASIPATWLQRTRQAIENVLAGTVLDELPPFDLQGSEFQQQVWNALFGIPLGETRSYGDLAKEIGNPRAVRAVGRACGANPLPLIIPCHRVLAADGKLGGFSGGAGWKPLLLAREGWSEGRDLPLFQNRDESDSS